MNRFIFCSLVFFTSLLFFSLITVAFAEEYVVEITDTGFIPTNYTINYTDSLGFVSNSTSDWIIDSELLLGGMHVINSQGNIWSGFNCGVFTVVQHKNYLDNLGLTPFTLVVENCPQPEITIETTFTNETSIPDVEDVEVFDIPLESEPDIIFEEEIPTIVIDETPPPTCGFTGWTQEGERNVAYRCGVEVASYVIDNPSDSMLGDSKSEYNQTLDLRLQILKVLESIFNIIFG